jgi:hypothetical protein
MLALILIMWFAGLLLYVISVSAPRAPSRARRRVEGKMEVDLPQGQ